MSANSHTTIKAVAGDESLIFPGAVHVPTVETGFLFRCLNVFFLKQSLFVELMGVFSVKVF